MRPVGHCRTGQFRSVVAAQHRWIPTTLADEAVEFGDQVLAGDAALHEATEALAGVFVDDRDDLDRSALAGGIELEVDCPHSVGCIGGRDVGSGGGSAAFAAPPLRHPKTLFTPKALDLLVIDDPTLAAGIVIGRPKSTSRMIPGVLAQPDPQRLIRVFGCYRDGLMALGGTVLPGDAAGEPLTDPQHPLKVTNGRPPTLRA